MNNASWTCLTGIVHICMQMMNVLRLKESVWSDTEKEAKIK